MPLGVASPADSMSILREFPSIFMRLPQKPLLIILSSESATLKVPVANTRSEDRNFATVGSAVIDVRD